MRENFPTLDLHGIKHEKAEHLIEDFILEKIDELPIAIITGHSTYYQELVKALADKLELNIHPQWWRNRGCWIITEGTNGSNDLFA